MRGKWSNLLLLATGELLAMGLWFSASAVVPQLREQWGLSGSQAAWLTMSVQAGFVAGALGSALLNLADRVPGRVLVAVAAVAGAATNAAIPLLGSAPAACIVLRFLTGAALAGVYPPGMKLVATWTREDRGLGIGLLVGALTVGSAMPHLLNAVPLLGSQGMPPWRSVLLASSALALAGGALVGIFFRPGPGLGSVAPFDWRQAGRSLTERPLRLANFGYLGHMWELYAMWTWVPIFLLSSFMQAGVDPKLARLAGFGAIAVGGLGSVIAGWLADRLGRTLLASLSLGISGTCCLVVGFTYYRPLLLTAVCLVWGFSVVADSAQFSAAVSELADPRYVGTSLTVQTSLGFLLTMASLWLLPVVAERWYWQWVFLLLLPGPVFGLLAMGRLRSLPESIRMAAGRK